MRAYAKIIDFGFTFIYYTIVQYILYPSIAVSILSILLIASNLKNTLEWLNMHYILDKDELIIHTTDLGKGKRIPYTDITSIKEKRKLLTSPTFSIDVIEIKFKISKTGKVINIVYISPKDKHVFLKMLEGHKVQV